jgi:hypothetical protein
VVQRTALKFGLLIVLLGGSWTSFAEVSLQDSRTWRRAKLISAGQQVWSFQSSYQKISDRFTTNGQVEGLGARHAQVLTWGQLLRAETDGKAKAEMREYMGKQNAAESDIAATAAYRMEREEVGFGVNWAYGLTKSWMIGFQLPVVLRSTSVSSRVSLMPKLAHGAGQTGQKSLLALNAQDMAKRVKSLAEQELTNSGYDSVPDQQQNWEWGDVSLLSQFYLTQAYRWRWALQEMVRFPTSQNPSVSDFLQQSSDDGQLDLGLTSLMDYRMRHWTLGLRAGYVVQLPDSAKMRVPGSSNTKGIDPKVHRDLGDWLWVGVDGDYRINRRLGLDLEYAYLSKKEDHYKGSSQNGVDYSSLSYGTDQEVHQTRVGLLYEIGDSSSRRGVENKWVASVGYAYPWIGRNSSDASRTSFELISYF